MNACQQTLLACVFEFDVVHFLKTATRQELEKKKEASRVRIPKVLDTSVESSSSEDELQIGQKETAKTRVSYGFRSTQSETT